MSDHIRSAPDVRFLPVGTGMHIGFMCALCGKHSQMAGNGLRMVRGLRTRVCAGCKARVDARRKG
jgi:hypothetical protein